MTSGLTVVRAIQVPGHFTFLNRLVLTCFCAFLSRLKNQAISCSIRPVFSISPRKSAGMTAMKNVQRTTRLLLAWFVLSMGVAVLAPSMDAGAMPQVCSSTGELYVAGTTPLDSEDSGSTERTWKCVFCWVAQIATPISTVIHAPGLVAAVRHSRIERPDQSFSRFRISLGARAPPAVPPI